MTAEIVTLMPRNLVQGSEEWKAFRCGWVTASRMSDLIAKTKTGWGASRANYMSELICERLTGIPAEHYINGPMQRGTDMEPEARDAYSFRTDFDVEQIGFVPHPRIPMAGASPDGFVGENGEIQIKCPNTATHIDTLSRKSVPAKYISQIQFGLACSGRQWCDFVSYDPRLPESMRLFLRRIERDDKIIALIEADVEIFLAELIGKIADLETAYCGAPSRLLAQLRESCTLTGESQ